MMSARRDPRSARGPQAAPTAPAPSAGGRAGRGRALLAAVAGTLAATLLAACASIPVDGQVRQGGDDVARGGDIGIIASGPAAGAEPEDIVRGFLLAAEAGPTSAVPFAVAREYLVGAAQLTWRPYEQVFVLDGPLLVQPPEIIEDDPNRAVVRASGTVVAWVDERGVYTEEPTPSRREVVFDLVRANGQWRVVTLEDGLLMPSQVFTSTFHRTRLYFPTPDWEYWVPDQRWFPQQTWRTNAVQELLAGPPEWMGAAATSVLPPGTSLALNSVTQDGEGRFQIPLTDHVRNASGEERGMFAAQVQATLTTGAVGGARVTLLDSTGPVVPVEVAQPRVPRTPGQALVLHGGRFWTISGRDLVIHPLQPDLSSMDPTAMAISHDGESVVLRDGSTRLVRVSGTEPTVLLEGQDLVGPSIDRFGFVWSGESDGRVVAVTPEAVEHELRAQWLDDRQILSVAVSPEGARIAIVSTGPDGTFAQVAGIVRDARNVPVVILPPVTVGPGIRGVRQVAWQDETVLAILAGGGADAGIYLSGIGGLGPGGGGLTRKFSGVTDVVSLTASVGNGMILALDSQGLLRLHQTSSVWPTVSQNIRLMAFPG